MDSILTREEIEKIIPHRDPILLVDEVLEMEDGVSIVTKYHVSAQLDIFRGHFPNEPIFPGVYTIECMAQASAVLALSMESYAGRLPLFLGVDKVSFKAKVTPGSDLIVSSTIVEHKAEKAIVICSSEVFLGDNLVATASIALALR